MYGKLPIPNGIERRFIHLAMMAGIASAGFFGKRRIEGSLENTVPHSMERKVASYALTIASGAAIGGLFKAYRAGTRDGLVAGLIVGTGTALAAGIASEIYDYRNRPRR